LVPSPSLLLREALGGELLLEEGVHLVQEHLRLDELSHVLLERVDALLGFTLGESHVNVLPQTIVCEARVADRHLVGAVHRHRVVGVGTHDAGAAAPALARDGAVLR